MSDDEDAPTGPITWINERRGVIIAAVGLVAWFALLWFMFGDVL